jgi:hypothetical protein
MSIHWKVKILALCIIGAAFLSPEISTGTASYLGKQHVKEMHVDNAHLPPLPLLLRLRGGKTFVKHSRDMPEQDGSNRYSSKDRGGYGQKAHGSDKFRSTDRNFATSSSSKYQENRRDSRNEPSMHSQRQGSSRWDHSRRPQEDHRGSSAVQKNEHATKPYHGDRKKDETEHEHQRAIEWDAYLERGELRAAQAAKMCSEKDTKLTAKGLGLRTILEDVNELSELRKVDVSNNSLSEVRT